MPSYLKSTVYLTSTVDGQAGLQSLGVDTLGDPVPGAKLEGKLQVNAVTFDSIGNMVNVQVAALAAGTSSGVASALCSSRPTRATPVRILLC